MCLRCSTSKSRIRKRSTGCVPRFRNSRRRPLNASTCVTSIHDAAWPLSIWGCCCRRSRISGKPMNSRRRTTSSPISFITRSRTRSRRQEVHPRPRRRTVRGCRRGPPFLRSPLPSAICPAPARAWKRLKRCSTCCAAPDESAGTRSPSSSGRRSRACAPTSCDWRENTRRRSSATAKRLR